MHKELKQAQHLVIGQVLYSARFYTGPLLFNIFVDDLFFFTAKCEICYLADDNSLYFCGTNLDNIFTNLIQDIQNVYE